MKYTNKKPKRTQVSYASEADFRGDLYYQDLCNEAIDDLNDSIARDIERGRLLANTLKDGAT